MIKNVLLVEDDLVHGEILNNIFENNFKNTKLTHVTSAIMATERVSQQEFDLLILDLSLPDCHGLDFLDYIDDNFPRPPVIIITGDNSEQTEKDCLLKGIDAYFIKPYDFTELIRIVKLLLIQY